MTHIDPAAEFYTQAKGHDVTGEFCRDCRDAHHGYSPEDIGMDFIEWGADAYTRTTTAWSVAICEGDEENDSPQSFRHRGDCAGCGTDQGGEYWPVIMTPHTNHQPTP